RESGFGIEGASSSVGTDSTGIEAMPADKEPLDGLRSAVRGPMEARGAEAAAPDAGPVTLASVWLGATVPADPVPGGEGVWPGVLASCPAVVLPEPAKWRRKFWPGPVRNARIESTTREAAIPLHASGRSDPGVQRLRIHSTMLGRSPSPERIRAMTSS